MCFILHIIILWGFGATVTDEFLSNQAEHGKLLNFHLNIWSRGSAASQSPSARLASCCPSRPRKERDLNLSLRSEWVWTLSDLDSRWDSKLQRGDEKAADTQGNKWGIIKADIAHVMEWVSGPTVGSCGCSVARLHRPGPGGSRCYLSDGFKDSVPADFWNASWEPAHFSITAAEWHLNVILHFIFTACHVCEWKWIPWSQALYCSSVERFHGLGRQSEHLSN